MTLRGLDHVGFTVSDLDHSIPWYTVLLGNPLLLRRTWDVPYIGTMIGYPDCRMECAFFSLPGGTVLELLQFFEPAPGTVDMETYNVGNGHLCLLVDDLQGEYERLRDHATFRSPGPVTIPWGPYAGGRGCYLRDPDGITIQLIQHPPGGPSLGPDGSA
ncbi:VOC family protein [Virgisporangium aurantiacum]|uniref:Glyoxalase n=1 Tax=Virgisporangium aurantiacum TaxID=175570 RepID=A0A8J3ZKL8_9ACTN|nr:VOC family protein [Virgisporangium aurantiacum]GIJ63185.1 glyoxalase [Virgisporangium aurantiacum]